MIENVVNRQDDLELIDGVGEGDDDMDGVDDVNIDDVDMDYVDMDDMDLYGWLIGFYVFFVVVAFLIK